MIATRVVVGALPVVAAAGGLAILHTSAHDYLFHQGFPLDDAWIHAVYARELARSATLAYNPGFPATGETSPLWALLLAIPHRLAAGDAVVVCSKLLGFALHASSAVVVALAVAAACNRSLWPAAIAGALVGLHPDLVAASVSGMEVPLATLVIAATAAATVGAQTWLLVVLGFAAFLARPETAVVAVVIPFLFWIRERPRTAVSLAGSALAGGIAAVAVVALRNWNVSGLPLPATFYAKTSAHSMVDLANQQLGFVNLLGLIPLVNLTPLLLLFAVVAVVMCSRPQSAARLGGALYLGGLTLCAVSFALIRPSDPYAFYHQRYILPALLPIAAAIPILVAEGAALVKPAAAGPAAVVTGVLAAVVLLSAAPARFQHLSNDARNIDDVQVAFGRGLGNASSDEVAWVVDAGASRYFGRATVVDLIGLNSFELLGPDAQAFLDRHPPRYLDRFPGWSSIAFERGVAEERAFAASTAYTVTSFPAMRQHTLVSCPPSGDGAIDVRGRRFIFHCAGGGRSSFSGK